MRVPFVAASLLMTTLAGLAVPVGAAADPCAPSTLGTVPDLCVQAPHIQCQGAAAQTCAEVTIAAEEALETVDEVRDAIQECIPLSRCLPEPIEPTCDEDLRSVCVVVWRAMGCPEEEPCGTGPLVDEALGTVTGAPGLVLGIVLGQLDSLDEDDDDVPDDAEAALCGRTIVADNINRSGHARCVSPSDLVLDPDTALVDFVVGTVTGLVLGTVEEVQETVDGDGDNVPDAAEPTLCDVEDRNTPLDGTCVGDDYTP